MRLTPFRLHVEWARTGKEVSTSLEVSLLLSPFDSSEEELSVSFSIGGTGLRFGTTVPSPDFIPSMPDHAEITLGKFIPIGKSFGSPNIQLYGFILLREQVKCARNGLWHLRDQYYDLLPEGWLHIMSYGRTGTFELEQDVEHVPPGDASKTPRS